MREFTDKKEYDDFLNSPENENKLVVIEFYAEWCGPCRKMKPFFSKCCDKYPDVIFAKVDVDEAEAISKGIEVMPTFIFFKNGVKLLTYSGSKSADLQGKIEELRYQ